MASIENSFANMTANVAGGFSNQILGQASYINRLQQGGSAAASGGSPEQLIARLNADPMLQQRAIQAMQNNPALIGKAIRDLSARPDLARQLPPAIKRFLTQAIQSGGY